MGDHLLISVMQERAGDCNKAAYALKTRAKFGRSCREHQALTPCSFNALAITRTGHAISTGLISRVSLWVEALCLVTSGRGLCFRFGQPPGRAKCHLCSPEVTMCASRMCSGKDLCELTAMLEPASREMNAEVSIDGYFSF